MRPGEPPAPMTTYTATILVVEDDRSTRELYKNALALAGFTVRVAHDGMAALTELEQHLPDAIVLDLDLPQVSGLSIREELAAHENTKDIPVVVVTGTDWSTGDPADVSLTKPVHPDEVVAAIRAVLHGRFS